MPDKGKELLDQLATATDASEKKQIRRRLRKLGLVKKHGGRWLPAEGTASDHVVTTLKLPTDLHRRLAFLAADQATSANAIVEDVLRAHLDRLGVPTRLTLKKETSS